MSLPSKRFDSLLVCFRFKSQLQFCYSLKGQRDKPFVTEDENELRTPRPDLLDRPYAPDYEGESFRNQYQVSYY